MARITLFFRGQPVTHHIVDKNRFSVGPNPSCDLVLARTAAEEQLTVYRTKSGKWQAKKADDTTPAGVLDLNDGARINVGPFSLAVESDIRPETETDTSTQGEAEMRLYELGWVGGSAAMHQLRSLTETLAPLSAPVHVTGESGTGKELIARGLHALSNRSEGPFTAVNCGGFTESLLEDTLFGHEKGAFSGAASSRRGVFEQADGGTLFLDEIGDLSLAGQAALLRVLDDRHVCRIGAEQRIPVNFRLVTATHRDLAKMVRKKTFRLDLFHRLSTLRIETFALRDHVEDIKDIAEHFYITNASELGPRRLGASALSQLSAYAWPGNVRELRNVLYRSAALCKKIILGAQNMDLPMFPGGDKRHMRLAKISPQHLADVLAGHKGNIAAAARTLGVPRTSLRDRIRSENIELAESMDLTG